MVNLCVRCVVWCWRCGGFFCRLLLCVVVCWVCLGVWYGFLLKVFGLGWSDRYVFCWGLFVLVLGWWLFLVCCSGRCFIVVFGSWVVWVLRVLFVWCCLLVLGYCVGCWWGIVVVDVWCGWGNVLVSCLGFCLVVSWSGLVYVVGRLCVCFVLCVRVFGYVGLVEGFCFFCCRWWCGCCWRFGSWMVGLVGFCSVGRVLWGVWWCVFGCLGVLFWFVWFGISCGRRWGWLLCWGVFCLVGWWGWWYFSFVWVVWVWGNWCFFLFLGGLVFV